MASRLYGKGLKGLMNGSIDLDTDTLKVLLTTSAYTMDADVHEFLSDITNEIPNGSGYTTGGAAVAGAAVGVDAATHRAYLTFNDVSWPSSTITSARYAILYKATGVAGTSRLIALFDLGGNKSTTGDTFYLTIPAAGSDGAAYITY